MAEPLGASAKDIESYPEDSSLKLNRKKWYHWYEPTDTPEERRLLLKLDLTVTFVAFVWYWLQHLDQSNISNAWVSGLSDDLNLHGNQLSRLLSMYTIGAVVFQLPCIYLFTKVPMGIFISSAVTGWGVITLLQYRATSYGEMLAYRFLVGAFEAPFWPGMHYVLGSWYKGFEISRRGGVFYVGLALGNLTASLVQGSVSKHLDGVHGLAGWRWGFIINSIVTIPIGLLGMILFPGTPDKCTSWVLTKQDVEVAKRRLYGLKHRPPGKFSFATIKRTFTTWRVYALALADIFFWNSTLGMNAGGFLLFLKGLDRYSVSDVNSIGAMPAAVGIFYILLITFAADAFRNRPGAIMISQGLNAISLIILVRWNVPEGAKWFAFALQYFGVAMSCVLYGWANNITRDNAEQRSLTIITMNTLAQSSTAWTVLLTYPTTQSPRYHRGYSFSLSCSLLLIALCPLIAYLQKREDKQTALNELSGDILTPSSEEHITESDSSKQQHVAQEISL